MENIIESLAKEEQAILIVALFLLIYVGIMINVMVREYRAYLDDYPMCHFSLGDFIRRGRFYICLILGVVFIRSATWQASTPTRTPCTSCR